MFTAPVDLANLNPRLSLLNLNLTLIPNYLSANQSNWLVFTAGCMGAGKGHTLNWLNKEGILSYPSPRFPLYTVPNHHCRQHTQLAEQRRSQHLTHLPCT